MLETIAWISIVSALACGLWILVDEVRHPQTMAVMNVVWPLTALYFGGIALWAYYRFGREKTKEAVQKDERMHEHHELHWPEVAVGTSHCGAGCMVADIVCEFWIATSGMMLFGSMLLTEYAIDFVAAWILGVAFQYFAIAPMRKDLSVGQALVAAVKADTLSIVAFQVGMYAWMAVMHFWLFPQPHLTPWQPVYWLMMQVGMICGFATSFPMNWWLIRAGLKESM